LSLGLVGGSYSVKTVADRYGHVAYHDKALVAGSLFLSTSMTLNDLEPPQLGVFVIFFVTPGCDTHLSSELRRNG